MAENNIKNNRVDREIKGKPSTSRIKDLRDLYFNSPLMVDTEYVKFYTEAHQKNSALNAVERRAECHAYALENLTPIIRENELLIGSKTRFVRGAIPYCNYASNYILREIDKDMQGESHDYQDEIIDIGEGGGVAHSSKLAKEGEYELIAGKFLIAQAEKQTLLSCAQYWQGKCMQDLGDDLWKKHFAKADYIENGWRMGLYTAPHDPAPEGRFVLDFETALGKGFNAIISDMRQRIKELVVTDQESAGKLYFWRSGIRALEATIKWSKNYSRAAAKLAAKEKNAVRKRELQEIAESCSHCPANPPRNFKEAMQSFWLIYLAGHIEGAHLGYSPGRFDRYMYPYYQRDIAAKKLAPEKALEWLEALRIKMTELEYISSFSWEGLGSGNLFQNMILGGLSESGEAADNELSYLVLQSAINCQTTQPTISIWYSDKLSEKFLLKAVELVKTGCGFPAWFNFNVFAQHEMQKHNLPLPLIRKYAAIGGCTEPTMEGMSYGIVQAGFINHGKLLELALNGGKDPRSKIELVKTKKPTNYKELVEVYKIHLQHAIANWQSYWNYVMAAHREVANLIYSSTLIRDCIGRGKSLDDGGAICNGTPTTLSTGMVNVANSLAAVKYLFDRKACDMSKLLQALQSNWQGFDKVHKVALEAPKWGNNDDFVDQIFVELYNFYCQSVVEGTNYLGEKYDPSMLAISTHTPFGAVCGATPDGRYSGEPLCDGVTSPAPGTDVNGPISVLLSAAKIDYTKIRGGLHNMKFHPTAISGIKGSKAVLSLIKSYFDLGGFQLQFNVIDNTMLLDAQKHPEKYRDLIVRVAGFSAFFVELSKSVQDQVIARTLHEI